MSREYARPMKHIWVYSDEVVLGPLATLVNDDGEDVNVWTEFQQVGMSAILKATPTKITISRGVWDAIEAWAANGFSGMPLHDYINRMFTGVNG